MLVDLENKSFCVFGLKGQGKSYWCNWMLKQWGSLAIVYDTMHEYDESPFDSYRPRDRQSVDEYQNFVRAVMNSRRYRLLVIDESNRHNPAKPAQLPQATADLNDWHRHPEYNLAVGHVARRPVQLNQDITELSNYLVIFHLKGLNDMSYLNSFAAGLGDAVSQLPPYYYALVDERREWTIMEPVK